MSKASEQALGELHGTLAKALTGIIRDGVDVIDKEGEVRKVPASPAYFKEARELLKDNHIEADVGASKPLQGLIDVLPFPDGDTDEEEMRVTH